MLLTNKETKKQTANSLRSDGRRPADTSDSQRIKSVAKHHRRVAAVIVLATRFHDAVAMT